MSNENNIKLTQAEVDKLLGITTKTEEKPEIIYKRETIATDEEISKFNVIFKNFAATLKDHFKEIFGEPVIRRISPTSTIQMSRLEYMSSVLKNDFIFLIEIEKYELLMKFDSFLFCALAGIPVNVKNKTNLFQNETIRTFIAPVIVRELIRAAKKHIPLSEIKITPLFDLPALEGLKTEVAGITATFSWNEGFKSLGFEKIFFQKDFLDFLIS